MSRHPSVSTPPLGAALHALSALTGQPKRFFLGRPADSSGKQGAHIEFVAMLLLDLDDPEALTARRRTATPSPALLAVVDELEHAEQITTAAVLSDDEFAGGWAA
ncbi:hypothetical protein EES39_38210 [Streptomyces sp. ADI92-24]|uniref:hypothetical protein n=1 Tax=Streptomyces sp. ADI92-24 TaxID=1522756 RepID=UPI000F5537D7|nr:hypothetical protein [Streptomyces sp. ADI92-24]RPK32637.1 hypothetical protein EES39_38210 [Streptomyces sp. ADI92-24]